MQVNEIMNKSVVSVSPSETASFAARLLNRHNIGSVPVCSADGRLHGMLTDRDIALRCVAADSDPRSTSVQDIMSRNIACVAPNDDVTSAANLMAQRQVRRLPVVENDKLVGIVSLGDIAKSSTSKLEVGRTLTDISENIRTANQKNR